MLHISASIVTYNEKIETLKKAIESFLSLDLKKELIIVDNSTTNHLQSTCENYKNLTYIKTEKNIGFGAGHNLAFANTTQNSDIHLVINPDTYFKADEIEEFLRWFSLAKDISLATPKICDTDGTTQEVVRNIPTPLSLIKRRLRIDSDELLVSDNSITDIPFAHGCFMVFKSDSFATLGGFDERFFLYMEDVDLWIRAKKLGRTVMNSNFKVYHEYDKGSSKSIKLLFYHIVSSVKFFT